MLDFQRFLIYSFALFNHFQFVQAIFVFLVIVAERDIFDIFLEELEVFVLEFDFESITAQALKVLVEDFPFPWTGLQVFSHVTPILESPSL